MKLYSALCNTMDNSVRTVCLWLFIVLKNLSQCVCVWGGMCVCLQDWIEQVKKWICLFMMCVYIYYKGEYSLKCSRTLDCYFIILYIGSCKVYVWLSFNVFYCWTQVQVSCHCSVSVQTKRIDRLSAQLCANRIFINQNKISDLKLIDVNYKISYLKLIDVNSDLWIQVSYSILLF